MAPVKQWTLVLATLISLSSTVHADSWDFFAKRQAEAMRMLDRRADTCPTSQPTSCSATDSKLPSDFCCAVNDRCYSLDSSSSALCCPAGQDCNSIATVSCDISLQDPSKHTGPIFTTKSGDLPKCGNECCPFGYSCGSNGQQAACVLDVSKAIIPRNTTGTVTTKSATTTTTSTSTITPPIAGIDSNDPPPPTVCNNFPVGVFLAGLFPGLVVGILLTLAWVVLSGRHKKSGTPLTPTQPQMSGARPYISAPINDNRHSNERSDFLGRTKSRARSVFSRRATRAIDTPDMFSAKMPTPPQDSNVPRDYISRMNDVPVTPARRVAHYNDDTETIDVYSPDTHNHPAMPAAAVAPLRGMQSQRRSISPPPRRDSGVGHTMTYDIGSPFETPERKHNDTTLPRSKNPYAPPDSPISPLHNSMALQTLSPARYGDETYTNPYAPQIQSKSTTTPSGMHPTPLSPISTNTRTTTQPPIPPRPRNKPALANLRTAATARPETQFEDDFDFDDGLSDDEPAPTAAGKQKKGVKREQSRKKHTTAGTTFTSMLRGVGFPDPGDQVPVPHVPRGYK